MDQLNLRNISNIKRELVLEAFESWRDSKNHLHSRADFATSISDLGWRKAGYGGYKECYLKGSIAVKFAKNDAKVNFMEVKREWEQSNVASSALKKYFPKIYLYEEGFLIQDRVLLNCGQVLKCDVARIGDDFRLNDYAHNHGHNLAGNVKFYDWVFLRRGAYLSADNINIGLGKMLSV